jgi:acetyltransferase-like isoleucine patch superfamily enzyme
MAEKFFRGIRNRVFQVMALHAPGASTWRVRLHRARGVHIGDNVFIGTSAILETAYPQLISIGNNSSIGIRTTIIAHFKETTLRKLQRGEPTVIIEDDVFIGPGVIILPNVTIGRGAVVMAGTVISKSVPPQMVVQGNPAMVVGKAGVPLIVRTLYNDFIAHLQPLERRPL